MVDVQDVGQAVVLMARVPIMLIAVIILEAVTIVPVIVVVLEIADAPLAAQAVPAQDAVAAAVVVIRPIPQQRFPHSRPTLFPI